MKRLISTLQEKWPEYILEILVITIGILGAFLLNSWNESKLTSSYESKQLTFLESELNENIKELQGVISENEKLLSTLDSFFIDSSSVSDFDMMIAVFSYVPYDPELPALTGILQNGEFQRTENLYLLNELRSLNDGLNYLTKDLEYLDAFWINNIHPYYIEHSLVNAIIANSRMKKKIAIKKGILKDPQFISLANNLSLFLVGLINQQQKTKAKMEEILGLTIEIRK